MLRESKTSKAGLLPAFLLSLSITISSHAESDEKISDLANSYYWKSLLHYKNGKSEIDDISFFLSKKGRTDPEDELIKTLDAFESSEEEGDSHPVCIYPARYYFLRQHININLKKQPICNSLDKFISEVDPSGIYLIFADGYINSPASMFGHTFLRINSSYKSKLLGTAVNYAANADSSEGFMYYIKGLVGLYKGYFSVFPYYKKVYEYNDLEHRDIWEFKLKATDENIKLLTLHLWELKDRYIYYYFFDKNCSYEILHLINLLKENLDATKNFNYRVIPTDTIRFLHARGMIENVTYRKAPANIIREFLNSKKLTVEEISTAKKLAMFELDLNTFLDRKDLTEKKKAEIMELSKLLFMYYAVKHRMDYENYQKKLLDILYARSKLRADVLESSEKKESPLEGHRHQMVSIYHGSEEGQQFIQVAYRTAYHSLEDKTTGYNEGSQVLFPETSIRIFPKINKTVLNHFNFINIKSLSPVDDIFNNYSWSLHFDLQRDWDMEDKNSNKSLFLNLGYGMGKTYSVGYLYPYFLVKTDLQANTESIENSRLTVSLESGLIVDKKNYKLLAIIEPSYLLKHSGGLYSIKSTLSANIYTSKNTAINLLASFQKLKNRLFEDYALSLRIFF